MRTFQVKLSEETARRLEALAQEHDLSAEDFVRRVTEEIVQQPDKKFDETLHYVLEKNKKLYRRLAAT